MSQHFIGPKAENISLLHDAINMVLNSHQHIRAHAFPNDPSLISTSMLEQGEFKKHLIDLLEKSKKDPYFYHPRYVAQMLKDPCIPAIVGYFNYLLTNPNNHAYEGGPVTTELEREVIDLFLHYFNFKEGWGHLCSGGTYANLEALWVIRKNYGKGKILFSEASHFAWSRICDLLDLEYVIMPVDEYFRLDINELEHYLKKQNVIAVIANLGSTGTGSVDDIKKMLHLREQYHFHLHVDAAYGGFTRAIILNEASVELPYDEHWPITFYVYEQLCALTRADSITVDPHKHGLVSYGAGAVFYRSMALQKAILHDAPYTYNCKNQLNLGMLSLEGSRPGAMASACYLTYKVFPLQQKGIGQILSATLSAAKLFHQLMGESHFNNLYLPDLDICCFYPKPGTQIKLLSQLNQQTLTVYKQFSIDNGDSSFILSQFKLSDNMTSILFKHTKLVCDEPLIALRCVLFKHWMDSDNQFYIKELINELEGAYTMKGLHDCGASSNE